VAPKLEKLERRTQRALIDIMQDEERRRLEEEGVQD
jgi:coiled-coil domain-containing protein 12